MDLLIYVTDECWRDADRYSLSDELKQFKERLVRTQRTTYFDNFPQPYLKKRFRRQNRLIAIEKTVGESLVVIFCRVLVRGGSDYLAFLKDPRSYGISNLQPLIQDVDFEKWVEETKPANRTLEKSLPNDLEYKFLYHLIGKRDTYMEEVFIYETHKWVKSTLQDEIRNRLILVPDIILGEVGQNKEDLQVVEVDETYSLAYRYFPEKQMLWLVDFAKTSVIFESNYSEFDTQCSEEDINRNSRKSYPILFLADEDIWISIQKNNESNLALSPEETNLLKSVQSSEGNSGFPLFINGRAGSGKSTILQYIFSDYLKAFNDLPSGEFSFGPVFLTYSNSLVESSKKAVSSLLQDSYQHKNSGVGSYKPNLIDRSIWQFKEFLLNSVPDQDKSKFNEVNYVDYSRFKKLWHEFFGKDPQAIRRYDHDISWHVIRSFIKGFSADGYLEKDEYEELPSDAQTVSVETFEIIYEKVWEGWFSQKCDAGLWDDQNLVRYLLETDGSMEAKYLGVFCDEAQDFTRIELELLLRINLFADRKIDGAVLNRVPFAFAGDPFQTLNPTGFRWESIKSTYVEKFINSLSPELRFGNPALNYQELSFNYRSAAPIVKLSNGVQLLRMILFGYNGLKPQQTWFVETDSQLPVFFSTTGQNIQQQIRDQDDLCIIIPCMEGEEMEFVQNDRFLKETVPIDESGVPQNVFSPMRAKGLEFSRVLVYGFGSYNVTNLKLNDEKILTVRDLPKKDKITIEYFINQLYVALTRARKRLFVVDTPNSFHSLWRFAADASFQDVLLDNCKEPELWESEIGTLTEGTYESWGEGKEDARVRAQQFEEEGVLKRDPYFLRQAAMGYKSAGNFHKEARCRGLALEYDGNYSQSAKQYIKCSSFEDALRVCWRGGLYPDIVTLLDLDGAKKLAGRLEVRASNMLNDRENLTSISQFLDDLGGYIEEKAGTPEWTRFVNILMDELTKKNKDEVYVSWGELKKKLLVLESRTTLNAKSFAHICYNAKDYKLTVEFLKNAGLTDSEDYRRAMKHILLAEYDAGNKPQKFEECEILGLHFEGTGHFQKAIDLFTSGQLHQRLLALINSQNLGEGLINQAISGYLQALNGRREWITFTRLFKKQPFTRTEVKDLFKKNRGDYLRIAVVEMATDAFLPDAPVNVKNIVSKFVEDEFPLSRLDIWSISIHPELVGSLVERLNHDVQSLKFYEGVIDNAVIRDDSRKHAEYRWVQVKFQQSMRAESQGKIETAKKYRKDAENKALMYNITGLEADYRYPVVSSFYGVPKQTSSVDSTSNVESGNSVLLKHLNKVEERVLGHIAVSVHADKQRINLQDGRNSFQAAVFISSRSCSSFDFVFETIENGYRSKEMELEVTFSTDQIGLKLLGTMNDSLTIFLN